MSWILIAADGSEGSETAVRLAAAIAWPRETMIAVVAVVPPVAELIGMPYVPVVSYDSAEVEQSELHRAQEITWRAVDQFRAAGHSAHCKVLRGRPADEIVSLAQRFSADLIVMGSRGLGAFQAALLGSVSAEVVDRAPCPVLIGRSDRIGPTLVADDGSPQAEAALAWLAERPYLVGTSARLVGVAPHPSLWPDSLMPLDARSAELIAETQDDIRSGLETVLDSNRAVLAATGVPVSYQVLEGNAVHALVVAAEEQQATLIVAGSHGRRGVRRAVLGSVSRGVVNHAHCSVLIVPPLQPAEQSAAGSAASAA